MNKETFRETCLPSNPESVSRARGEVREWLGESHPAYENTRLAVSELVTNAVRHASHGIGHPVDPLVLRLTVTDGGALRVEVTDRAWATGEPRIPVEPLCGLAESGRGLAIVSLISDGNWGYRSHGPGLGRTVWCEVPARPPSPEDPLPDTSDLLTRPG
ncbi:anti-sigma regulatory factor (Ser/Thr protein kinase) [Streptosporangium album]|uniref:Anti-sigma regulatory factor (Ser/Thr protein kinase) n=1 Tax=Streptosporangium album TaxID=47479 RepID=A0A7W7RTI8_9ACTN|nr:ATP-binding protein [Streptosporangium album]MBB4937954.1 anti-sigma regulatory factor (Ser/Thr protein kinase) [Streptosporangium album]